MVEEAEVAAAGAGAAAELHAKDDALAAQVAAVLAKLDEREDEREEKMAAVLAKLDGLAAAPAHA